MKTVTAIVVADECIQCPHISLASESHGCSRFLIHHVAHVLADHNILVEDDFVALVYEVGHGTQCLIDFGNLECQVLLMSFGRIQFEIVLTSVRKSVIRRHVVHSGFGTFGFVNLGLVYDHANLMDPYDIHRIRFISVESQDLIRIILIYIESYAFHKIL